MTSHVIETSTGTKLHYLQSGNDQGPLLICLHGLGGSTATFAPIVSQLPQSYNIILVDFPGFGSSPPPASHPTVPGYVSDLHDLVASVQADNGEKEELKPVVLFGHSLGSAIALHFAAKYPPLVAGLALLGPARSASHIPAVRQRMLDMAANTRKMGTAWAAELASKSNFPSADVVTVDERLRKEVCNAVAASDAESYALTCEMMVDPSHLDPDYSQIKCQTLFIAGSFDVISPVGRSKELVELIGSDLCTLKTLKTGHQPILEDTTGVTGAIVELLGKV